MVKDSVLIVDDEKNIRLTLSRCLEQLELEIDTAVNGEDALKKFEAKGYNLVLLDLKMPGIDGIQVLKEITKKHPGVRVIIITAYGTIENAVEAMKLGAVDFIQKPVTPDEVRSAVSSLFDREKLEEDKLKDYEDHLEFAKRCINRRKFDLAAKHVQCAIGINSSKPEAFNLKGALLELKGEELEAQKMYRAALELDPTYKPAQANLHRTTESTLGGKKGKIIYGEEKKKDKEEGKNEDK